MHLNSANSGGGLYGGTITNSTVVLNTATNSGGGVYGVSQGLGTQCYNSIIYYNAAPSGADTTGTGFTSCCTPSAADSSHSYTCITNEPLFVDLNGSDFHLRSISPCINSGDNHFVSGSTDLDAQSRISGGTVDIGCYESPNPASSVSYAWLEQYGFPTDGSGDALDPDGDSMSNWQEWVAGTDPTNALSRLKMEPVAASGNAHTLRWQSISDKRYYIQRSTNLAQPSPFTSIQSNIFGFSGYTSFTDSSATNAGPYFYRVGIQ